MPVLRELHGSREFPLGGRVTVLGRDPACDITIPRRETSGRHALIVHLGTAYYVEDLESVNGTRLNGERVRQRTRLSPGDRIEIPGLTILFCDDAAIDIPAEEQTLCGPALAVASAPSAILSSLTVEDDWRVEVAPEAKLRAVLEISKHLGTTLDLTVVLPRILESLFTVFPQADRGFVLLRDATTGQLVPRAVRHRREQPGASSLVSRTVVEYALRTGRAVLSADAGHDERFDVSESVRCLQLRSIMCVPLLSQRGAGLGVLQLDTLDKRKQFRQEDLDVLASASTQAARAVELAQLHQELRDLEAATQIQQSFLPERRPRVNGLEFFEYYSPARHVGGDYYDYIPLPGNRLAVAVGDVSGKGVPAALMMARLSAAARFCLATAPSLPEAVRQLSTVLTRVGTEDRFITFVVVVLDLEQFTLTLVNAGHMPPIRRRATAAEDVGAEIAGVPLAVLDRPYEQEVIPLAPGDVFVLYTDGVTEARDDGGEFYGVERLRAVIGAAPDDVEGIGKTILADVKQFGGERPQGDDLTLVCFSRRR